MRIRIDDEERVLVANVRDSTATLLSPEGKALEQYAIRRADEGSWAMRMVDTWEVCVSARHGTQPRFVLGLSAGVAALVACASEAYACSGPGAGQAIARAEVLGWALSLLGLVISVASGITLWRRGRRGASCGRSASSPSFIQGGGLARARGTAVGRG